MNDANDIEELYNNFVNQHNSEYIFFEESQLIEIFDYATDLSEDGVRMKVINYSSRVYPDSIPLAERKALLFYDLNDFEEVNRIIGDLPPQSFIGAILRLRLRTPDMEGIIFKLDEILESVSTLEDEWLNQLIDFAEEYDLYYWLLANQELIVSKIHYPQTFYYEMAVMAIDKEDIDRALEFTEELITLEPFNGEFWELQSSIYINHLNDIKKGENAIDYALAINPKSLKALIQKSQILAERKATLEEITNYLDQAIKLDPDLCEAVIAKALYNSYYDKNEYALEILKEFYNSHPSNMSVVEQIIKLSDDTLSLDFFIKSFDDQQWYAEEEWSKISMDNFINGDNRTAAYILKLYDRYRGLTYKEEYFSIFYEAHCYQQIIELYERHYNIYDRLVTVVDLIYVYSRIKTNSILGLTETVKTLIENLMDSNTLHISLSGKLERKNLFHYLKIVHEMLLEDNIKGIIDMDPFV